MCCWSPLQRILSTRRVEFGRIFCVAGVFALRLATRFHTSNNMLAVLKLLSVLLPSSWTPIPAPILSPQLLLNSCLCIRQLDLDSIRSFSKREHITRINSTKISNYVCICSSYNSLVGFFELNFAVSCCLLVRKAGTKTFLSLQTPEENWFV